MFTMNLKTLLCLCIILCLHSIYAYNITLSSSDIPEEFINLYNNETATLKEEVLKYTDSYYWGYYCRNNTCIRVDNDREKPYIEFPDENGKIKKYIAYTCAYNNFKANECVKEWCRDQLCALIKCTKDADCLYNKCSNNYCIFNEQSPIIRCDNIYTPNSISSTRNSYIYCGKAAGDTCVKDDECSYKVCSEEKGICGVRYGSPSENEGLDVAFLVLGILFVSVFIIGVCCCCCYTKIPKTRIYIKVAFIILFIFMMIIMPTYRWLESMQRTSDKDERIIILALVILYSIPATIGSIYCLFSTIKKEIRFNRELKSQIKEFRELYE